MNRPFIDIVNALKQAIADGKIQGTNQVHYIEIDCGIDKFYIKVDTNSDGSKDIYLLGCK